MKFSTNATTLPSMQRAIWGEDDVFNQCDYLTVGATFNRGGAEGGKVLKHIFVEQVRKLVKKVVFP